MKLYCGSRLLWDKVARAATPYSRFKGLMGRRALLPGEGLVISPCNQVHGFHMHFALDILFLDREMRVLHITALLPGGISPRIRGAACVLEVAAGSAGMLGVVPGDVLSMDEG